MHLIELMDSGLYNYEMVRNSRSDPSDEYVSRHTLIVDSNKTKKRGSDLSYVTKYLQFREWIVKIGLVDPEIIGFMVVCVCVCVTANKNATTMPTIATTTMPSISTGALITGIPTDFALWCADKMCVPELILWEFMGLQFYPRDAVSVSYTHLTLPTILRV